MTNICNHCNDEMQLLFTTNSSVAVNQYSADGKYRKKLQNGYLCQKCGHFFNDHSWSMTELFTNYKYFSPDTAYLDPVLDALHTFCSREKISTVCEVGGNSGLFLAKLKKRMPKLDCTNIDKWHDHESFPEVATVDTFVDDKSGELLEKLQAELIVCRHMFAHNPNVDSLLSNIVSQLSGANFIYIENADLYETLDKSDFGQFYAEHYYAFTPFSVINLLESEGYNLIDYKSFEIHNGSFGLLFSRSSDKKLIPDFNIFESKLVEQRFAAWLNNCLKFEEKINSSSCPVALYAVSAKFVFTANAFLSAEFRNCFTAIYDNTPQKIGLYPPGFSCPVSGEQELPKLSENTTLVIGARNFYSEIKDKLELQGIGEERIICPPF